MKKRAMSFMSTLALGLATMFGACVGGIARGEPISRFLPYSLTESFPDPQVRALVQAACAGDEARVLALTASGVDPNAPGRMLIGPGDILGPNLNDPRRAPVRPLGWMLVCRSPAGVRALVAAGADPETRLYANDSLIEIAIWISDVRMLQALLDAGADPNACGSVCPISASAERWRSSNSWRLLDILIANGLDIDRLADQRGEERFRDTALTHLFDAGALCKALSFVEQGPRRNEPLLLYLIRSRVSFWPGQRECAAQLNTMLTQRVGEEAYQAWLRDWRADQQRRLQR